MKNKLLYAAVGKMLQQNQWEETYNPDHAFDVNPYDYDTKQDYLNALRKKWQWHLDPWQDFSEHVNVIDYDQYEEYEQALEVYQEDIKDTWKTLYDPEDQFITNPHDFTSEMDYLKALKEAWKDEHDYYDEFPSVSPNDYDTPKEYQEAVLEAQQEQLYEEWKEDYDPEDNFFTDPSDFTSKMDYLNALKKEWKKSYDRWDEFPYIDPDDFIYASDYQEAVEEAQKHISFTEDYPNFFFLIDPYDYPTQQAYLDALYLEAKNRCEKYHLFHDLQREDFKTSEAFENAQLKVKEQRQWKKQWDYRNFNTTSPYDYDTYEDYQSACHREMMLRWKDLKDPDNVFPEINPLDFEYYFEYIDIIDTLKKEWQEQYDPDQLFSVDPVDFNNEHDYLRELHDAWKEKYDDFDEFPFIDPNNYDTHEDYHAALQEAQKQ